MFYSQTGYESIWSTDVAVHIVTVYPVGREAQSK